MRSPNTAIGELAVQVGSHRWFFRPSLFAMSQIGTPKEIVETYAAVMGGFSRDSFYAAVRVLWACCGGDASELTGYVRSYGKWVAGLIPPEDVVVLAQSLMNHGVTSNVEPDEPPSSEKYSSEFKPADSAALAMAHLGLSEDDAWNMTMTGLVLAMKAKYANPGEKTKTESLREADDTMGWLEKVNAMRDAKNESR